MSIRQQAVTAARQLIQQQRHGVLSTTSVTLAGYPFGSVTPVLLDDQQQPLFYMSDIAQHSKNLKVDQRASLTVYVQAAEGDQNEQGRATVVGEMRPLCNPQLLARYFRWFPAAQQYQNMHDFRLWQMHVKRVRYIGGFGDIFWLEKHEWQQPEVQWQVSDEQGMLQHMNSDHSDANQLLFRQAGGRVEASQQVEMVAVAAEGCLLQQGQQQRFIEFPSLCLTPLAVRQALVELTRQARQRVA